MLNLKEFIEIDNILIEAFICEASYDWNEHRTNEFKHIADINGRKLKITINMSRDRKNREHDVSFDVDDTTNKHDLSTQLGRHVLHHVAKAVHHYAKNNMKKGDYMTMYGVDRNKNTEFKKNIAYRMFGNRLAKHIGGRYSEEPVDDTASIHIIKKL